MNLPNTDTDNGKTLLKTYALIGRLAVLFPWLERIRERQKQWENTTEAEREQERHLLAAIAPLFDAGLELNDPRDAMPPTDDDPYWSAFIQFRHLFAHGLMYPGPDGRVDIIDLKAVEENQKARQEGRPAKREGVFGTTTPQMEALIAAIYDYLNGDNNVNGGEGIWWVTLWEKVKYDCYPDSNRVST